MSCHHLNVVIRAGDYSYRVNLPGADERRLRCGLYRLDAYRIQLKDIQLSGSLYRLAAAVHI